VSNIFHKNFVEDDIHAAVARIYDDITARDADTSFNTDSTNVNKLVRVDSPLAFYVLTAITPSFSEFTNGSGAWTDLSDTPASISANLVVQGNAGGTALEFGQDLKTNASPTFNHITVDGDVSEVSVSLDSTDAALLLNRLTTTQRDALTAVAGMQIFNTTTNQSQIFNDTVWVSLGTVDISCKVTKTADQSIPRITLTMVTWDSEEYDTDDMHDTVTNNTRITFNTAGKYSILAQSEWEANSGGFRFMDIMKNGVDSIARVRNLADNASEHNIAFVGEFAVGDYIELEVFQDTGGNLDFESGAILENTYLEAHKIN